MSQKGIVWNRCIYWVWSFVSPPSFFFQLGGQLWLSSRLNRRKFYSDKALLSKWNQFLSLLFGLFQWWNVVEKTCGTHRTTHWGISIFLLDLPGMAKRINMRTEQPDFTRRHAETTTSALYVRMSLIQIAFYCASPSSMNSEMPFCNPLRMTKNTPGKFWLEIAIFSLNRFSTSHPDLSFIYDESSARSAVLQRHHALLSKQPKNFSLWLFILELESPG